jgi:hypothetical protein
MGGPRIVQVEGQIGFYWVDASGRPVGLPELVATDSEPRRLIPTHLAALDDALIDVAGRFGPLLDGSRSPEPGGERDDLTLVDRTLERLNHEYAEALGALGRRADIRAGQIVGTSALLAVHARMALGTAGPGPLAGELQDPRLGVLAGHGRFHEVSPDEPWRGGRWVLEAEGGARFPLTLAMLMFDSSGVNRDAALDEHRQALSALTVPAAAAGADPVVMAGAVEWLLFDWLTAHRESPQSAAVEIRNGRVDDAAMIVAAAATVARLHARTDPAVLSVAQAP